MRNALAHERHERHERDIRHERYERHENMSGVNVYIYREREKEERESERERASERERERQGNTFILYIHRHFAGRRVRICALHRFCKFRIPDSLDSMDSLYSRFSGSLDSRKLRPFVEAEESYRGRRSLLEVAARTYGGHLNVILPYHTI